MDSTEIEKAEAHIIIELLDYMEDAVVSKTILKKLTGEIKVRAFASDEGLSEKTSPFDSFIQVIDGKAEIVIDGISKVLQTGDGIIAPAHKTMSIKPNGRFKMISTVIKSGYED